MSAIFASSPSTISQDMEKVKWCIERIMKIDSEYEGVKSNNIDAFDMYFGLNYMKDLEGRSQVYTSDLADTIEWMMPSLVKIFAGGDDVTSLTPRKREDAEQVARHNELVNYQLKIKNKWFLIINDWFKDALLLKRGAIKEQWWKEIIEDEKEFENLTHEELLFHMNDPNVTQITDVKETIVKPEELVASIDPTTGLYKPFVKPAVKAYNCTIHYRFEEEYPLIDAVPSEEYGFPLRTRDIEDCTFFYHMVKYDKWSFIARFGEDVFKKVENIKNTFLATTDNMSVEQQRFADISGINLGFFYDMEEEQWLVYECFFRHPDTGKPWFRAICGNILLEDFKNKYRKAPFQIITPIKLAHRLVGMSIYDLLKDLQKIRTSLIRIMLDTGYFNLNGRWVVDPTRLSLEDFIKSNKPGGVIRTLDGNPANQDAIMQIQGEGLPNFIFELFETVNKEKDYHGGVPRSFQGVNPQVLNRTMRGQNQQVQLAQQRVEMIARLFAEMGVAPLIRDIVDMNSRFLKKEQAIKVVNDWVDVTPEDVIAKADVIINVGLGTTSKDILVSQNQQMIQQYLQLYPLFGQALNNPILHALKEQVKAMGYRDTQNWVPGEMEAMQAQIVQKQEQFYMNYMKKQGTQPGQAMPVQGSQPLNVAALPAPGEQDYWG